MSEKFDTTEDTKHAVEDLKKGDFKSFVQDVYKEKDKISGGPQHDKEFKDYLSAVSSKLHQQKLLPGLDLTSLGGHSDAHHPDIVLQNSKHENVSFHNADELKKAADTAQKDSAQKEPAADKLT